MGLENHLWGRETRSGGITASAVYRAPPCGYLGNCTHDPITPNDPTNPNDPQQSPSPPTRRKASSAPFSMYSVRIMVGAPWVTTPRSLTTLGWANCPIRAASPRNSRRCLSPALPFNVFTATGDSGRPGRARRPRQTSPNSPGVGGDKDGGG